MVNFRKKIHELIQMSLSDYYYTLNVLFFNLQTISEVILHNLEHFTLH